MKGSAILSRLWPYRDLKSLFSWHGMLFRTESSVRMYCIQKTANHSCFPFSFSIFSLFLLSFSHRSQLLCTGASRGQPLKHVTHSNSIYLCLAGSKQGPWWKQACEYSRHDSANVQQKMEKKGFGCRDEGSWLKWSAAVRHKLLFLAHFTMTLKSTMS